MNRPFISSALKTAANVQSAPAARAIVFEHCLTGEASPMVGLAMTIPAGCKFSANEVDCGQVASAYKHAILQVKIIVVNIRFTIKFNIRIIYEYYHGYHHEYYHGYYHEYYHGYYHEYHHGSYNIEYKG